MPPFKFDVIWNLTDGSNSTKYKAIWKLKLLVHIPKWAFKQADPNNDAQFNQTIWWVEMPFPPEKTHLHKVFQSVLKRAKQDFLCQKEPVPVLSR